MYYGRTKRAGFLDQVAGPFLVEFHRPDNSISPGKSIIITAAKFIFHFYHDLFEQKCYLELL